MSPPGTGRGAIAKQHDPEIVEHNLEMLNKDMRDLLMRESWGGTGGTIEIDGKWHCCAAANGCIDQKTGRIVAFGNLEDLDPTISEENVRFALRVTHLGLGHPGPGKHTRIVSVHGGEGLSKRGLRNLEKAIAEFNSRHP
jgi:hypothetical protein